LIVLELFVENSKEIIDKDEKLGHPLVVTYLIFSDVTLKEDVNNKVSTGEYLLHRSNLSDEVNMILSREYLFQIAQAYEIVETFLYNQVSEFINSKNSLQLFIDQRSNVSSTKSIRKALKTFSDRKNNRHLLNIIRSNCDIYSEYERSNIYDLDFGQWYEMFSEVRHCITHSKMAMTPELKDSHDAFFKKHFRIKKYDDKEILYIERLEALTLFSRIADFVLLIHKAISKECFQIDVNLESIKPILKMINNKTADN